MLFKYIHFFDITQVHHSPASYLLQLAINLLMMSRGLSIFASNLTVTSLNTDIQRSLVFYYHVQIGSSNNNDYLYVITKLFLPIIQLCIFKGK